MMVSVDCLPPLNELAIDRKVDEAEGIERSSSQTESETKYQSEFNATVMRLMSKATIQLTMNHISLVPIGNSHNDSVSNSHRAV
jgi:hypothetical protein